MYKYSKNTPKWVKKFRKTSGVGAKTPKKPQMWKFARKIHEMGKFARKIPGMRKFTRKNTGMRKFARKIHEMSVKILRHTGMCKNSKNTKMGVKILKHA